MLIVKPLTKGDKILNGTTLRTVDVAINLAHRRPTASRVVHLQLELIQEGKIRIREGNEVVLFITESRLHSSKGDRACATCNLGDLDH